MTRLKITVDNELYAIVSCKTKGACIQYAAQYVGQAMEDGKFIIIEFEDIGDRND
jgi:hypothetical protein